MHQIVSYLSFFFGGACPRTRLAQVGIITGLTTRLVKVIRCFINTLMNVELVEIEVKLAYRA